MYREPSLGLRLLYGVAVLSAVFPYGMSGWVSATRGGGRAGPRILMILPVVFFVIGVWRIYHVFRHKRALGSYVPSTPLKILRMVGIVGMIVGAAYLLARLGAGPVVRALDQGGDISTRGVMSYVVGVYFAFFQVLVAPGVMFFELSRLLGFERQASESVEIDD